MKPVEKSSAQLRNAVDALANVNCGEPLALDDSDRSLIKEQIQSIYNTVAGGARLGDIWNWGVDRDDLRAIVHEARPLSPESDSYSEQLYLLVWAALRPGPPLKRVLEVGCGLGGGLRLLSHCNPGVDFVGIDLSQNSIEFARRNSPKNARITFAEGDAERLPFEDSVFDAVINVESSHNYPDLRKFLLEVARVLKPGGGLSHADCFTTKRHDLLVELKSQNLGLSWRSETDISPLVRAAIRQRLQPGSIFRAKLDSATPSRQLTLMQVYGADFAGHKFTMEQNLMRKTEVPVKMAEYLRAEAGYLHNLAQKR